MEFPGFLGNQRVKDALYTAFGAGRFPHALIFQGEPGTGKKTLARLVAQALVCAHPDRAPCGVCPGCIRAQAGSHPDIRIIEGSGVSGTLSVEAVRFMTEDASRMPEEASYNVYILHLGEHTTPAAQNKLLKVIEEPPKGAVFLMLCKNAQALLPTIRSRAQIFTLVPPEPDEAAEWLVRHGGADPGKARELAALCGGNLGRMQAELKDGGAGQAFAIAQEMAEAVLSGGAHRMLKAAADLQKDRELFREVLSQLTVIFRDACALRCGEAKGIGGAPELAEKLSGLPMKRLVRLPELAEDYSRKLDRNANMSLLVTCFCAQLR